jgi:hypothetical protein
MGRYDVYEIFDGIAKEASTGKVDVFFTYRLLFETKINGKIVYSKSSYLADIESPVLEIKDLETFKELLKDYLERALEFYKRDTTFSYFEDEDLVYKTILTELWSNASYEDFVNPNEFLKKRIGFFDDLNIHEDFYCDSLGEVSISSEKSSIHQETPHCLVIRIIRDNNIYTLPIAYFGVYDNKGYVYAIQNKSANQEGLNELLEPLKEGLQESNTNSENLRRVSKSFLLTANILLGVLARKGVDEVIVNSLLPVRYNSKQLLSQDAYAPKRVKEKYTEEKNDDIQQNITNHFLRVFRRVDYHHTGINITSYPMELDTSMHIKINEQDSCNNKILEETFKEPGSRKR